MPKRKASYECLATCTLADQDHVPSVQKALLLYGAKQRYEVASIPLPELQQDDEVLIRIERIGLNPVDHKSVDYNFALPTLPAILGRDAAGVVVKAGPKVKRLQPGDIVFGPSTSYRDYRTSTFQSYAIARESSLAISPANVSLDECAAAGVGISTAALALSSALGVPVKTFAPRDDSIGAEGEDWISDPESWTVPDVREGEPIVIWGGASVTGFYACQLARLAGLRVIAVADKQRHENRLLSIGVERVIDRHDVEEASRAIRRLTSGSARLAIDCVGKTTAQAAIDALATEGDVWVVGLSGLPKAARTRVHLRSVPIKTFHTNPAVGSSLMSLVEQLLKSGELRLCPVEVIEGGLDQINDALDRLRSGKHGFGRLVIRTPH